MSVMYQTAFLSGGGFSSTFLFSKWVTIGGQMEL